jgi:hypothetical protein
MPLRAALISSLTQTSEDDRNATSETRALRIELAKKVSMLDIVELTLDNVIFISRYLNRALVHPAIYTTFIGAVEEGIQRTSAPAVAATEVPPPATVDLEPSAAEGGSTVDPD